MTRSQLEHAIRAACDVSGDTELWVFGSQAILGQFPDAPEELRRSAEADVAPRNHPERAGSLDGPLGELSQFHRAHGFYVHGLSIDAATLPEGWQDRTIAVPGRGGHLSTGHCLDGHDLAASKLAAFREKDLRFVRILLAERMIQAPVLLERISRLPVAAETRERLRAWVIGTTSTAM